MKINTKVLLCTVAGMLLWGGCGSKKEGAEKSRPHEPWVFRSVMDGRPRMVTAALHDDVWVCYDAQHLDIYKIWKGGVLFDGAVYNTKHGPQPNTRGYAYYENQLSETPWRLIENGNNTVPKVNFKGYEFREGRVYFKYEIQTSQGIWISIEDSPEYRSKSDAPGLERIFITTNVPSDVKVILPTRFSSLRAEDAYSFDGELEIKEKSARQVQDIELTDLVAELMLNSNATSTLTTYFHPGVTSLEATEEAAVEVVKTSKGEQLIEGSDCHACHNAKVKTVGPSYLDIAKKYPFTDEMIESLAQKIIKGGSGNWGNVAMTAHPDLPEDDAIEMASYILSLDGEQKVKPNVSEKLFLEVGSVPFVLDQDNSKIDVGDENYYPGMAVNAYKCLSTVDLLDYHKLHQPQHSGVLPVVHAREKKDLGPLQEMVLFEIHGYIDVPATSNYTFRLANYDQSWLFIDGKEVIDYSGWHSLGAKDGETYLKGGRHALRIVYMQGSAGGGISFQWAKHGDNQFGIVPNSVLSHQKRQFRKTGPYVPPKGTYATLRPGFGGILQDIHPSFDLAQVRPASFQPRVGGMDFLPDGRLVVCTWDSVGPVYVLDGFQTGDSTKITVKRIAQGLAEPLGIKVVDGQIYVLQKQELTRLIDHDGDELIDEYQTVCDDWTVTANFHEFAFGLEYKDGYFYGALATAIQPGGAGGKAQAPDRGKVVKIGKDDGSIEFVAEGLRTPNGIGLALDDQLFVCDNQGDWLPSSKLLHVQSGAFYNSYAVNPDNKKPVTLPLVWMPQDEVGNSPSEPTYLNVGPYQNQIIYGEVTNGGIKRVFVEKVNGALQGALFRFSQGLEAGVNRLTWGPDGGLYVGGIGVAGNWGQDGKLKYGLQRLSYNSKTTFEMLAVRAKANGFEIEFTEPIAENEWLSAENFLVKHWYYEATPAYGGPKKGTEVLKVKSLTLSPDRKTVFLEITGLKKEYVVYFLIQKPFLSATGQSLWNGECWYTLNNIPSEKAEVKPLGPPPAPNTLSEAEKAAGWQLLFDGQSTAGWHRFKAEKAGAAWKAKDGTLYLDNSKKDGGQIVGGGDIVTDSEYENFDLRLEWKIAEGGNSGIIYKVAEKEGYDFVWKTGPEMQILDNERHGDAAHDKHRAGDLYDLIACNYEQAKPALQWNEARIISQNGKVSHYLNGHKVVEFEMYTPEWEALVANSKFKDMPGFGTIKKGRIALQDHGDQVWFRNIKIREL
ncbi:MAG: DUF1080 domain-containing protein [Cytophagales bacterium]|nr:DUF1080 domain-containing protein [Cytophagales bacterium]